MICFDTQILVWGVQGKASNAEEQQRVDRTRRYIRELGKQKARLLVPAPALAEYLCVFNPAEQARQFSKIRRYFAVVPFDEICAVRAAKLFESWRTREAANRPEDRTRNEFKIDMQIIACAVIHRADTIVTQDKQFASFAAGEGIKIIDVPDVQSQGILFEPDEAE